MYQPITDFILDAGKRLKKQAGNIADIGITKQFLTEEDLRIERGLTEIIEAMGSDHSVYAEEEHDAFTATPHVWVIDPISSTKNFIEGLPHYAIVVAHLYNGEAQFAAVYDPSVDELFTAYKNSGAYLNGEKLEIRESDIRQIIFRVSAQWTETVFADHAREKLTAYELTTNTDSVAIHYCDVARGKVTGMICFAKDSFPHFAGVLIAQESGGCATNEKGESNISPQDRIFVAGTTFTHNQLISCLV